MARVARSPHRPSPISPSADPSMGPSRPPVGRWPRGSARRTGRAEGSKSSIPTSSRIDETGTAEATLHSCLGRYYQRTKDRPQTSSRLTKIQPRADTRSRLGSRLSREWRAVSLRGEVSGTAHSWRRGQSSVWGEARGSAGVARVHTGVDVTKIALFTDSYLPTVDGVVTSVLTTRRQLEANGHEVVVFAPEDPRGRGKREAGTIYVRAKEFAHYPGYRLAMFPGRETDLI